MLALTVTSIKTGFDIRTDLIAQIKSQTLTIAFSMILNSIKLGTRRQRQIIIHLIQLSAGTKLIFLITMAAHFIFEFRAILICAGLGSIVDCST